MSKVSSDLGHVQHKIESQKLQSIKLNSDLDNLASNVHNLLDELKLYANK